MFDLETGPLPEEQLLPIMPEFEASRVLKDPDKIKADLEAKKAAWLDSAALKATTGRVIAFSICHDDQEPEFHCTPDEKTMLEILAHELKMTIGLGGKAYAYNAFGYDLPFMCARCAAHEIPAFKNFTVNYRGRWSWNEAFIDPMQVWVGPGQRHDGASLKAVAYALGVGLKTGDGKDFAKLLRDDPIAAKQYSLNDVLLLRGVVAKLGI